MSEPLQVALTTRWPVARVRTLARLVRVLDEVAPSPEPMPRCLRPRSLASLAEKLGPTGASGSSSGSLGSAIAGQVPWKLGNYRESLRAARRLSLRGLDCQWVEADWRDGSRRA